MKQKPFLGLMIALTIFSVCAPTLAIDDGTRAAARTLVSEGVVHYRANRYDEARLKFLEAYAVAKVPTVAVWAGQAHEKLGKWVAAAEYYENALLMQPNELWVGNAQQQAQEQAEELLNALKPRLPGVKILLVGTNTAEVDVTIDGAKLANAILAVERPLDPGTHAIVATRGSKATTVTVTLVGGEKKTLTLEAPASTAQQQPSVASVQDARGAHRRPVETSTRPDSRPLRRSLGWASLGMGATGLVVGVTAATVVGIKRSELHDAGCNGNICDGGSFSSRVDSYNAWRTISTASFVVGGIGVGLGLTLLVTRPRQESSTQVSVMVSPGSVGFKGAF